MLNPLKKGYIFKLITVLICLAACSCRVGMGVDYLESFNTQPYSSTNPLTLSPPRADAVKTVSIDENWLDSTYLNVIMVARGHPHFPQDDIIFPNLANLLIKSSPYFNVFLSFSSGKEFVDQLKSLNEAGYAIGHLAIMGHSGTGGFFAKDRAGLYSSNYQYIKFGRPIALSIDASRLSDLQSAISSGEIVFRSGFFNILIGCNTTHGPGSFGYELAQISERPTIGTNQKVDLYHVENPGEDLKGMERGDFILYYSREDKVFVNLLSHNDARVSDLILQATQFCNTSDFRSGKHKSYSSKKNSLK